MLKNKKVFHMGTICTFENGDWVEHADRALVAHFAGTRRVLSTAPFNGGLREDLRYVFNRDCKPETQAPEYAMRSYADLALLAAQALGLEPAYCAGILTAAQMENAAQCTETHEALSVTAIVTGGILCNANRAGDPASWEERPEGFRPLPGTVNILLFINACLTPGAMAQSLITATEAKTVAVQELLTPSCYSNGLATGSGTDGAIIVCDPAAPLQLTDAGKHGKLGELIARSVIAATKEALYRQTGQCARSQHNTAARLARFGLQAAREDVPAAALLAHLLDELRWGTLEAGECRDTLDTLYQRLGIAPAP